MSSFVDTLETEMNDDNVAYTENDATAFHTTNSSVLDFFATGGAFRSRDDASIIAAFERAYNEDALLATKALFYFRDVRGGQGERKTFRILLQWLAENHPEAVKQNVHLISEYGRWDDLYVLFNTPLRVEAINLIHDQLILDTKTEHPSLLAKWLKSENTSSKTSRALARETRKALDMSSRQYRKTLSELRRKIGLVEQQISANKWKEIEYDKIPSKAGLQYRKAFYRHDEAGYSSFLKAVKSGEKKINVKDLYPYEIIEKVLNNTTTDTSLDIMWDNLPDYFNGNNVRGLVVADTSGSMGGRPITVAVSLAMYMAERNKGEFKNKFITFSHRPRLQSITGKNLSEKVHNLYRADWDMNTDIKAVFDLVLQTALKNKMSQDMLPSHLYIVSDMEFDNCTTSRINERVFQTIAREYSEAGYQMPFLVFWNVDSRNDQQPMSMDQRGFQMVSGCSPSIFSSLLANKTVSAYDLMIEVLNGERYAPIEIKRT